MKKSLLIIVMSLAVITGFAQENKWNAGLVLGYGTELSKASIGARVIYDVIDPISIAGSFNYYFKESYEDEYSKIDTKWWDINVDFHWNVLRGESYKVYPLVGLTYLHVKQSGSNDMGIEDSGSDGKFGANLGVGGQYNFSEHFAAAVEAKYQIIDGGQFVPALSVMYRF